MADVVIRAGRAGDGQGLASVWLDTGTYYAELDPERFQVPDQDGLAEVLEQHWTRPIAEDRFNRVAELDGQVVGLVSASIEEPLEGARHQLLRDLAWRRLQVRALAVRTAFWRKGIGRQLLVAAENWGRSRGARLAQLDTAINSPVSVPFYDQGMGYTRQSLVFRKPLLPT